MSLHINISGANVPLKDIFTEFYPSLKHFAGCIMKRGSSQSSISGPGQHSLAEFAEESEDAVQDVFLHLCDKDLTFSDAQSFKAFLYISVRNSCIDKIRRSKRHGAIAASPSSTSDPESTSRGIDSTIHGVDSSICGIDPTIHGVDSSICGIDSTIYSIDSSIYGIDPTIHDVEMDESDFIELIRREERFRILEKAIANLAPQSRKIMEMHIHGIPNKKIAETLGISENTVKTLKARAIETIKKSSRP